MSHSRESLELHLPTLFVGLGGAGARVVNRIAGMLKDRSACEAMADVAQFLVVDTDRVAIDEADQIPLANKFIISGFDKGAYAAEARGQSREGSKAPNPRVTQWLHPWYSFRSSRGAGAGQIRIESRLALFNALETGGLMNLISQTIASLRSLQRTHVDTRTGELRVFMYFSVAGGTGSGTHMTMAYAIRDCAARQGLSANITGVAILPTLFLDVVKNPRQQTDILCNGYAALTEIEHMMKLKITSDDPQRRAQREFIHHPHESQTTVQESPFDFVYLIDTPPNLHVGMRFADVVADGIYLQIASPIFGKRNSDYDNYEKNQKRFAAGLYSTFYGSFGTSVLALPDGDILHYCARHEAQRVFEQYFETALFSLDGHRFPSTADEEAWRLLPDERRHRLHDWSFLGWLGRQRALFHEMRGSGLDPMQEKRLLLLSAIPDKVGAADGLPGHQAILNPESQRELVERLGETAQEALRDADFATLDTQVASPWFALSQHTPPDGAEPVTTLRGWRLGTQKWLVRTLATAESWLDAPALPDAPGKDARSIDPAAAMETVREDLTTVRNWVDSCRQKANGFAHEIRSFLGRSGNLLRVLGTDVAAEDIDLYALRAHFTLLKENLLLMRQVLATVQRDAGLTLAHLTRIRSEIAESLAGTFAPMKEISAEIRAEAPVTVGETVLDTLGVSNEARNFENAFERYLDLRVGWCESATLVLRIAVLDAACDAVISASEAFLATLRRFNGIASQERMRMAADARHYLEQAGPSANQFVVDVEALADLNGQRLWDTFYEWEMEGRGLEARTVIRIITDAFLSDTLRERPNDIAVVIRERIEEAARQHFRPLIVGEQSDTRHPEKCGLLLHQALEKEILITFVKSLRDSGRFAEVEADFRLYREKPDADVPGVRAFRAELKDYASAYLQFKIQKCVRLSGILANVNTSLSEEVGQYACRQFLLAYNKSLYGDPSDSRDATDFPSVARLVDQNIIHANWTSSAGRKRAIFYQAILGLPLFAFHNVVGQLKEAYLARCREREEPVNGQKLYPLHIDRNWEPGEVDGDPARLPLSLDPNEAVRARRHRDKATLELALVFLQLVARGELRYATGEGYFVPTGALQNKGDEVFLGRTLDASLRTLRAYPQALRVFEAQQSGERTTEDAQHLLDHVRHKAEEYGHAIAANTDVWHPPCMENPLLRDLERERETLLELATFLENEIVEREGISRLPSPGLKASA